MPKVTKDNNLTFHELSLKMYIWIHNYSWDPNNKQVLLSGLNLNTRLLSLDFRSFRTSKSLVFIGILYSDPHCNAIDPH